MSGLTIKTDDMLTHGGGVNRMIDILMSGALLSNIEMEKAGYVDARTFNFPGDVTYGQKNSPVEAHNICFEINKFYGLAGNDKAYIVMPAHTLAERGYYFMEQDGFHVLPPGYKGPDDPDGASVSLRDIPFRIVADKKTSEILYQAMKKSGLYSEQQMEEAFVVADNMRDAVSPRQDTETLQMVKDTMRLDSRNHPVSDIVMTEPENKPRVTTRAFPQGDGSHLFRNENPETEYVSAPPVIANSWKMNVRYNESGDRVFDVSDKYEFVHTPDNYMGMTDAYYAFKLRNKENGRDDFSVLFYDPDRGMNPHSTVETWQVETYRHNTYTEACRVQRVQGSTARFVAFARR